MVVVNVNGAPLGALFEDRLQSVEVTDEAGIHADSCVITLDNRGAFGLGDPYLRVMNGSGVEIARNDDGGPGYNSQLKIGRAHV